MRKKELPPLIYDGPVDQEAEESPDLLSTHGIEINRSGEIFSELSERYEIPIEDIRYMDLNRTGIYLPNKEVKTNFRARFLADVDGLDGEKRRTWFALPVRTEKDSGFSATEGGLFFENKKIGDIQEVELDTCDVSYQGEETYRGSYE